MKTKKVLALLLVFAMLGSLTACGASSSGSDSQEPAPAEAEEEAEAPEEAAEAEEAEEAEAPAEEPADSGEAINLTFSLQDSSETPQTKRWQQWGDEITERTNGRVTFTWYYDSTLLDPNAGMEQLKAGVADCGDVHKYANDGFILFEKWQGMTAGCPDEGIPTLGKEIVEAVPRLQEELAGLHPLMYAFGGSRYQILSVDKPVHSVADVKGMVIWCEPDWNAFFEGMGAQPVNTPWSEVYSSLQKHMYDGLFIAAETLQVVNFAEVCKYATMTNIAFPSTAGFFMNEDVYNNLPADIKAVFDDPELAAKYEMLKYTETVEFDNAACEWAQEEKGTEIIELTDEEHQEFIDYVNKGKAALVESFDSQGLPGTEWYNAVLEVYENYEKENG